MPIDLLAQQGTQPTASNDESRIMGVLNQNSDKNFVQRILKPKGQPTLDLGDDNFATHKMSWTTADGKPIVYPNVIQDPKTGQLKELSSKDAIQHALKNNEFITMKNGKDAEWFSSNYKKVWNIDGKNISLKKGLAATGQPKDLLAGEATGGIVGDIRQAGGILPFLRAIPLGAQREITRITGAPQAGQFALGGLAGQALVPAKPQIPAAAEPAARVGGALADIAGFTGASELGAPLLGELGGAGFLGKAARSAVTGFPAGAAVSPGHRVVGGLLGMLGGTGAEALKGAGTLIRKSPNLFIGRLAKNITRTAENQKQIGNQLYQNAFRGTENLTPTISQQTGQSVRNLQELFPGKQSSVNKALAAFQRQPGLEGLHGLRSDLSKVARKIGDKAVKAGLDSNQIDQQAALDDTVNNLVQDTKKNLANVSPQKAAQYEQAQQHWKNNVIPFRNLLSVRKLLGVEKEVSPSLFKDIGKESISAARLRELTGVPKGIAQTGQFLHRKYLGLPVGVWLAAGIGSGLSIGKHRL